ncbi:unnamed protein product, partial [Polarella glacialis]
AADLAGCGALYMPLEAKSSTCGTWLLQSHGWIDGTLDADFDPSLCADKDSASWPSVLPRK